MKRLPLMLAGLTALFLLICLLQAYAEVHHSQPAGGSQQGWWRNEALTELGCQLTLPGLSFGYVLGIVFRSAPLVLAFYCLYYLLVVVLPSALVFLVARLLCRRMAS